MRWLIIMATVLAVAACSGGEGDGGAASGKAPAPAPAPGAADALGKALEASVDPKVASCLRKVQDGDLAGAYPVCLEAAKIDPDNNAVSEALAEAKAASVAVADAEQQGRAAVDDAKKQADSAAADAQKQADDAVKNALTPPKMP